jgi:hypothetical protein
VSREAAGLVSVAPQWLPGSLQRTPRPIRPVRAPGLHALCNVTSRRPAPWAHQGHRGKPWRPVDTFVAAASIASSDPRLAPTSLGMGGGAREAEAALLERASVRNMRLRGGLLIQINPKRAWEARGCVGKHCRCSTTAGSFSRQCHPAEAATSHKPDPQTGSRRFRLWALPD